MITVILMQSEKSGHPVVTANSKVVMEQLLGNSVETCFATTTMVTVEIKQAWKNVFIMGCLSRYYPHTIKIM